VKTFCRSLHQIYSKRHTQLNSHWSHKYTAVTRCMYSNIIPVLEDLQWLSASSLQGSLDGLELCSWCRSSLSQRPLHTRYCHLRSSASAICSNWYILLLPCARTATGQQSIAVNNQPHTRNRLPPALRTCTTPVRARLQAGTEDAPVLEHPAPLRHLHDSGAGYQYPDLLTYSYMTALIITITVIVIIITQLH